MVLWLWGGGGVVDLARLVADTKGLGFGFLV
jgi:hypothetical protein